MTGDVAEVALEDGRDHDEPQRDPVRSRDAGPPERPPSRHHERRPSRAWARPRWRDLAALIDEALRAGDARTRRDPGGHPGARGGPRARDRTLQFAR